MWRYVRQFPKFFVAFVLVVAGVGILFVWNVRRAAREAAARVRPAVIEDIKAKVAVVEAKHERLILADNDLYDIETGELIFKNWLKKGEPIKLFWEPESKTFLAQYELAFVRYGLDGLEKASLVQPHPFAVALDYKWIVFARDKEIWRAGVDWKGLKLVDERKLTSIGQFNDQYFTQNLLLGTEKTLIVRNLNQLLRVNLDTGDIHATKLPMQEIGKRRSPDNKSVVGIQNGQFYCYDAESDEAKSIQVGRGAINDYQWLGNDRCVAIAAMKAVLLYDRPMHTLTELAALPSPCNRIGEPSPDGRFVFALSGVSGQEVLVDVQKKTALPVTGGQGVSWVSNDTFAFSREIADSTLRGTWLQTVGQGERRVSPEPYLVGKGRGFIMPLPAGGIVVFATKNGLSRMKPDGTELGERVKLFKAPGRVLGIQEWKTL